MCSGKATKSGKYIFVPSSSGSFYRLNMTNTSDIIELTSNLTSAPDTKKLGQVNINEGVVLGANYVIHDDTVSEIASPVYDGIMMTGSLRSQESLRVVRSNAVDVANYAWCNAQTGGTDTNIGTFYIGTALILPYLATIQNLNETIIKTSERTMKIEYTISNTVV